MLGAYLFGESHSASIGAILNGMPAGVPVDETEIDRQMDKRRAKGNISTKRHEADRVIIESGIFNDIQPVRRSVCGLKIRFSAARIMRRRNFCRVRRMRIIQHFCDMAGIRIIAAVVIFSGRLTAPIVAAGAICMQALARRGILIGSHIRTLHTLSDRPFSTDEALLRGEIAQMNDAEIAVLDETVRAQMIERMEAAAKAGDSVGGTVETAVVGLPGGVGEPFFRLGRKPAVRILVQHSGSQRCDLRRR